MKHRVYLQKCRFFSPNLFYSQQSILIWLSFVLLLLIETKESCLLLVFRMEINYAALRFLYTTSLA